MKLAQATASASSLAVLMPGVPKSRPPEQTFLLGPWRATQASPAWLFPGVSPWTGGGTGAWSSPCPPWGRGNGDRNATLAIGVGDKIRAELVSARCY